VKGDKRRELITKLNTLVGLQFKLNQLDGINKETARGYMPSLIQAGYVKQVTDIWGNQTKSYEVLDSIPSDVQISMFRRSKEGNGKSTDRKELEDRVLSAAEYIKFLEDELARERRDHADLRGWVDRTMKKLPEPKCYRHEMPA